MANVETRHLYACLFDHIRQVQNRVRQIASCKYTAKKRHRLDTNCGFYRPDASCIKPVDFTKLNQVSEHQTCCNLILADLL